VLLLDPLVGTGRTACRAVQVRQLQLCSLVALAALSPTTTEQVLLACGLQQGQTLFLVMVATLDAVVLATANLHVCTCLVFLQVLLARGVQQDKILFLSMVAAPEAIHKLCGAYPGMKVLTSEIDRGLDEHCRIVPGIGEFGERYFSD
jgi:uracil phosphoribosyltransferase